MEAFLQLLRSLEKNSIRLTIAGPAPAGIAATRFGGVPDVPADFQWPIFTTATFDDDEILPRPLSFLAQFNCAELAPLDREGLLPHTGLLSFFYELGSQRWGFDPADAGCARVFWFPETAVLSPAEFPDALPREYRLPAMGAALTAEPSWPSAEDFYADREDRLGDWEPFFEAQAMLDMEEPENRSCLLGWPDVIQGSMFRECELTARGHYLGSGPTDLSDSDQQAADSAKKNWQLLFQLDTVEGDGFELMFGDCGRIYFYIRKEDLSARRFDRVWLILQCG